MYFIGFCMNTAHSTQNTLTHTRTHTRTLCVKYPERKNSCRWEQSKKKRKECGIFKCIYLFFILYTYLAHFQRIDYLYTQTHPIFLYNLIALDTILVFRLVLHCILHVFSPLLLLIFLHIIHIDGFCLGITPWNHH